MLLYVSELAYVILTDNKIFLKSFRILCIPQDVWAGEKQSQNKTQNHIYKPEWEKELSLYSLFTCFNITCDQQHNNDY